jgi:hypothetical protein
MRTVDIAMCIELMVAIQTDSFQDIPIKLNKQHMLVAVPAYLFLEQEPVFQPKETKETQ